MLSAECRVGFNSKFGPGRDWMGKVDMYTRTEEDLDDAIGYLKCAYDEYETLQYLQYEFMENHEKLSDTLYRTTYSDGITTLPCLDLNKESQHNKSPSQREMI